MEGIRVSVESLHEHKNRLAEAALAMKNCHDQVNRAAHSSAQWTGDSKTMFDDAWQRWGTVLNDLHEAFDRIGGYVNEAALLYQQTDENVARNIQNR